MVSGQRHEITQRRPATAIHIPVALCDAPGVKTKILSTKKGPGCKHRSRSHGESGEVFLLDTLSHRMSVKRRCNANLPPEPLYYTVIPFGKTVKKKTRRNGYPECGVSALVHATTGATASGFAGRSSNRTTPITKNTITSV